MTYETPRPRGPRGYETVGRGTTSVADAAAVLEAELDVIGAACRARRYVRGLAVSPFLDDQARAARATRAYTAGGAQ